MDEYQKFKNMTPEEANAYLEELNACSHDCSTCEAGCDQQPVTPKYADRIIAVAGGKGGTGKSSVAVMLAYALAARGKKAAILDADVPGASVPQMMGAVGPVANDGENMFPVEHDGIKLISMALVSELPEEPIIYPSSDLARMVGYFYAGTRWGELDYMLIDMPTGVGDVALDVYTTIPFDGAVIVTTPGRLSAEIATRTINLCEMLMVPVVGIVEIFASGGEGGTASLYKDKEIIAAIPYDPELALAAEKGRLGGFAEKYAGNIADALIAKG